MKKRTTQEIREDLQSDREALSADLNALLGTRGRGKVEGGDTPHDPPREGPGALAFLAGAGVGLLFLARPLWPLRVVGRLVGLAAPVAVPLVIDYFRDRRAENVPFTDDVK